MEFTKDWLKLKWVNKPNSTIGCSIGASATDNFGNIYVLAHAHGIMRGPGLEIDAGEGSILFVGSLSGLSGEWLWTQPLVQFQARFLNWQQTRMEISNSGDIFIFYRDPSKSRVIIQDFDEPYGEGAGIFFRVSPGGFVKYTVPVNGPLVGTIFLSTDDEDNAYLGGTFNEFVTIEDTTLPALQQGILEPTASFIARINNEGELDWLVPIRNKLESETKEVISIDDEGFLTLLLKTDQTITVPIQEMTSPVLTGLEIVKNSRCNNSSKLCTSSVSHNNSSKFQHSIENNDSFLIVTGMVESNTLFDGINIKENVCREGKELFLMMIRADTASYIFSKNYEVNDPENALTINSTFFGDSHIYLLGNFAKVNRDNENKATITIDSKKVTFRGGFILKFDLDLKLESVKRYKSDKIRPFDMAINEKGQVFVSGFFEGCVDFGNFRIKSITDSDTFVMKLGEKRMSTERIHTIKGTDSTNVYQNLSLLGNNNLIVSGNFDSILHLTKNKRLFTDKENMFVLNFKILPFTSSKKNLSTPYSKK